MMVEAGGTEDSWKYYEDGAPKVTEEVLADGPRGGQDVDPRVDRAAACSWWPSVRAGQAPPSPTRAVHRLRGRRLRRGWRPSGPTPIAKANTDHRARPSATPPSTRPRRRSSPQLADEFPERERRDQGRGALAHQEARAQAHRRGGRPHRRPGHRRHPPAVGRGRTCFPTAHGSALFQRGETQVLNVTTLGMPRMNQLLDTISTRRAQALHAPLQLPALLHRRDRLHAGPEAPRDRPRPAGRAGPAAGRALRRRSSPTPCAWCPTCCPRTARPRWRRCAARRCR